MCSISSVIQAQVADDLVVLDNPDVLQDNDFNLVTSFDPPGMGREDYLLEHEVSDEVLRGQVIDKTVPSLCSIFR